MLTIRKLGAVGVLVGVALTGGVPATAAGQNAGTTRTQLAQFDGEDLFRGLVLGAGPVAQHFPGVKHSTDPATKKAQELIVEEIATRHPAYFDTFARQMRSGDHLVIREGILAAGDRLLDAVDGVLKSHSDSTVCVDTSVKDALAVLERVAATVRDNTPPAAQKTVDSAAAAAQDAAAPVVEAENNLQAQTSIAVAIWRTRVAVAVWSRYWVWVCCADTMSSPGDIGIGEGTPEVHLEKFVNQIATTL